MTPTLATDISLGDLATAIAAMDGLNSFVRTLAEYQYPGLRHHVYAMKASALVAANELGLLVRRPIFVRVKCGKCRGSGVWAGRYDHQPCRACNGMGVKRLDFTESTIGPTLHATPPTCAAWTVGHRVWHSPRCAEVAEAEEATDWTPRTPGRPMTPTEVAEALNVVEPVWPSRLYSAGTYVLWLGQTEGACVFCGEATAGPAAVVDGMPVGTFARRGRLAWRGDVCGGCRKHWEHTARRYGSFTNLINARMPLHPDVEHPAIAAWIERHGGLRAVKTATAYAGWGDPSWD